MPIDWAEQLSVHRRWLETVVRCRLGNSHDVEDVLQDVALAVMPHPNRPTEVAQVAPWLYRVTLRKVINVRRSLGRRRRMLQRFSRAVDEHAQVNESPVGSSWLLRTERYATVREAMAKLPIEDQEILTLKYSEDWSYQELANHLGVSIKTVEYRLLRARNSLALQLREWAE